MEYTTVRGMCRAEFSEKRSRFIASLKGVPDEESARRFIDQIKAENRGARHNVFAYRLISGVSRCSDDGEPQGTGGMPALGVLEHCGLVNVAVVVTRYFGGVLLGAPGLTRAYAHAAKLASGSASVCVMRCCAVIRVRTGYKNYALLERLVSAAGGHMDNVCYNESVEFDAVVPQEASGQFQKSAERYADCLKIGNPVYCEQ